MKGQLEESGVESGAKGGNGEQALRGRAFHVFEEMRLLHARRVAVDGHAVKGDGTRSRDPHSTANAIEILSAEIGRVGIAVVQSTNICHVERWRISLKAPVKYTQQQARRDGSWLSSGSLPRIASFKARGRTSAGDVDPAEHDRLVGRGVHVERAPNLRREGSAVENHRAIDASLDDERSVDADCGVARADGQLVDTTDVAPLEQILTRRYDDSPHPLVCHGGQ